MSSEKVSTFTIRLTAEEAAQLDALKALTGRATGSEALKYVMREYPRFVEHYKQDVAKQQQAQRDAAEMRRAVCVYVEALRRLEAVALRE
ncbi:hypothetical protein [Bacteroides intestinalis]|uniref:hypothetical protein n=1 Tax=Bacteroides intestinalis TaxID=329854 RepID=UPI00189A61DE|nr:hypothetical protein [Bacteroides intestinalis]